MNISKDNNNNKNLSYFCCFFINHQIWQEVWKSVNIQTLPPPNSVYGYTCKTEKRKIVIQGLEEKFFFRN